MDAPPTANSAYLVGHTLDGGLHVLAALGRCAQGEVFSAQTRTGRPVTLLFPPQEADAGPASSAGPAERLRIRRERVGRSVLLSHPHVAEVYAAGEISDGSWYVVLDPPSPERPVSATVAEHGPLEPWVVLDIIRQAAAGLQAAHALETVHGNLSPDSVLVARGPDGHARARVGGFYLPLVPRGSDVAPAGTDARARYASPEQLRGQLPDERSDVYGLGAVLHYCLTGLPPTGGELAEAIPPALHPALSRALAHSPADRFPTVAAFAAALQPPVPKPAVQPPTERRFEVVAPRRPNRRTLLLGAAGAVLTIALGIGLLRGSEQPVDTASAGPTGQEGASVALRHEPVAPKPTSRSAPRPKPSMHISPFRRAHPWVAVPGGKYYYRSTCPEALRHSDLLYFETEKKARAEGYEPSTVPRCR